VLPLPSAASLLVPLIGDFVLRRKLGRFIAEEADSLAQSEALSLTIVPAEACAD
jgi:hypothetical protein